MPAGGRAPRQPEGKAAPHHLTRGCTMRLSPLVFRQEVDHEAAGNPSGRACPGARALRLLPATSLGWLVVGLLTAAATLLLIGIALAASGQQGGEEFSDNLWLAIPMLGAGLSAVIAGAVAAFAVSFRRERSALTFLALVLSLLVLIFMIGEAFGHE